MNVMNRCVRARGCRVYHVKVESVTEKPRAYNVFERAI